MPGLLDEVVSEQEVYALVEGAKRVNIKKRSTRFFGGGPFRRGGGAEDIVLILILILNLATRGSKPSLILFFVP